MTSGKNGVTNQKVLWNSTKSGIQSEGVPSKGNKQQRPETVSGTKRHFRQYKSISSSLQMNEHHIRFPSKSFNSQSFFVQMHSYTKEQQQQQQTANA